MRGAPRTVVVVDDSRFMRGLIADILESGGVEVVGEAADGAEALSVVADVDPDVVTMDVEMPRMNGIAADDPAVNERRLSVTASDISEEALAAARADVYETTRTTDIDEQLGPLSAYEPYVEGEGDVFRVRDSVTERVTFERRDLIDDEPRSNVDLLFCRNLLIYIDTAFEEGLFETLRASLREGGYLVVGETETVPPGCRGSFEPVAKRSRIYRYTG